MVNVQRVRVPLVELSNNMDSVYVLITLAQCQGTTLAITGQQYHHLARVRRVRVGAHLRAVLPDGRVLLAEVTDITPDTLQAAVTGETPPSGVSTCRITLYQAVLKGDKMDLVVQKACELGIHAIIPLLTQRSIPALTPDKALARVDRWQRIADAAAEQCERSVPLQVYAPQPFTAASLDPHQVSFLLHEREGLSLRDAAARYPHLTELALLLGPEGGWDPQEAALLCAAGALPLHLGGRILRAETAALAAAALAQYLWGDL